MWWHKELLRLSPAPSDPVIFLRSKLLRERERDSTGHPCSCSQLEPQTVSCILGSWELLNSSHSFLLWATQSLCRQTWHLPETFRGFTIIKAAFVVASVVVAEIVVNAPPCSIKSGDVILQETGLQLPRTNQPNAEVPHLYWLRTSIFARDSDSKVGRRCPNG